MKKRVIGFLAVFALMCLFPLAANAAIVDSGTCGADGANVTWTLDDEGTLTISGNGDMKVYYSTSWYSYRSNVTKVIIDQGVTSIDQYAFDSCRGLTSVAIPDSVTSIGKGAFYGCSGLTSIDVNNQNQNYCSIDGNLFDKNKKTLLQYAAGKKNNSYTIPNSVTSIGSYAFYGCSSLKSVYYYGTEEQWKNIGISSYNYHLTDAKRYYLSSGPITNPNRYNENAFKIIGVPDTDELTLEQWPIANAAVTFGGMTKYTDAQGRVSFSNSEVNIGNYGVQSVTVSADGYLGYSQEILLAAGGENTISLTKKDPNKIYIQSIILTDANNKSYDLLRQSGYTADKTDLSKQTVKTVIDWNGHTAGNVYLQGSLGKQIKISNGETSVSVGQEFEADEGVTLTAVSGDGITVSKENVIRIVALPPEFTIIIPEQSSGDMSAIPFMPNMEFKLGLDKGLEEYASKVEVKDGKLILEFADLGVTKKKSDFKFFNESKLSIGPYGKLEIPINQNSDGEWSGSFGFKTVYKKRRKIQLTTLMCLFYHMIIIL